MDKRIVVFMSSSRRQQCRPDRGRGEEFLGKALDRILPNLHHAHQFRCKRRGLETGTDRRSQYATNSGRCRASSGGSPPWVTYAPHPRSKPCVYAASCSSWHPGQLSPCASPQNLCCCTGSGARILTTRAQWTGLESEIKGSRVPIAFPAASRFRGTGPGEELDGLGR